VDSTFTSWGAWISPVNPVTPSCKGDPSPLDTDFDHPFFCWDTAVVALFFPLCLFLYFVPVGESVVIFPPPFLVTLSFVLVVFGQRGFESGSCGLGQTILLPPFPKPPLHVLYYEFLFVLLFFSSAPCPSDPTPAPLVHFHLLPPVVHFLEHPGPFPHPGLSDLVVLFSFRSSAKI